MADTKFLIGTNCERLVEKFGCICRTVRTFSRPSATCTVLCRVLLMAQSPLQEQPMRIVSLSQNVWKCKKSVFTMCSETATKFFYLPNENGNISRAPTWCMQNCFIFKKALPTKMLLLRVSVVNFVVLTKSIYALLMKGYINYL